MLNGETFVNRSVANDPVAVLGLVRTNGDLVHADLATALTVMTRWIVRMAQLGRMNRIKNGSDKTGAPGWSTWQHGLCVATRSRDERRRQSQRSSIRDRTTSENVIFLNVAGSVALSECGL